MTWTNGKTRTYAPLHRKRIDRYKKHFRRIVVYRVIGVTKDTFTVVRI